MRSSGARLGCAQGSALQPSPPGFPSLPRAFRRWRGGGGALGRLVGRALRVARAAGEPGAVRLLLGATAELCLVDLHIRRRSLGHSSAVTPAGGPATVDGAALERAARYARWIGVAARFHVVRARCLHRSLVLHRWLRREGLPSELRIGVRKRGADLQAHAWIELGGHVVGDPPDAVATFRPLDNLTATLDLAARRLAA